MALKIVRGKNLPIGVDLGSTRVKVAQLRVAAENLELVAASAVDIPPARRKDLKSRLDFIAQSIRAMMGRDTFKGREAILSLPAQATFLHHVKMPQVPEEHMDNALRMELQGKTPYAVEDATIRYVIAGELPGEEEKKVEVIVAAVPSKLLNAYLSMSRRAGLDVVGVNIEPCAIVECFARLFRRTSDVGRSTLFVDIGANTTQVVLAMGSKLVFARNLKIGGETLEQQLAEAKGVPLAEAVVLHQDLTAGKLTEAEQTELYRFFGGGLDGLADEINQCLRYYESVFRNQSIERAIFVGGLAYDKRLCQLLAQRLNLPAQVGDPFLRIKKVEGSQSKVDIDCREPQPAWAVAVGLSLGATQAA